MLWSVEGRFLKSSKIPSEDFGLAQSCRDCQNKVLTDRARDNFERFKKCPSTTICEVEGVAK